jgi:hypothetical protein
MENIMIELPLTRESYLEILMREFDVSPLTANAYYNEHQDDDEFVHVKDILKSNTEEDVRRCHTLVSILAHGEDRDKGIDMGYQYYSKYPQARQFKASYAPDERIGYIEKYKLFLLTALSYNDDFYMEVQKWYREIFEYTGKIEEKLVIFLRFPSPIGKYPKAASGTDTGLVEFDSPIELEDGVLHILGDTKNRIRFEFAFKKYPFGEGGAPAETVPYSIRFFFTTTKESTEPEGDGLLEKDNIIANNPQEKDLVIQSKSIENIVYTEGIFILGRKNE